MISYREAMDRYGVDKPDLRFGIQMVDLGDLTAARMVVFADAVGDGGRSGMVAPGGAGYSRKQLDELEEVASRYGAKGW